MRHNIIYRHKLAVFFCSIWMKIRFEKKNKKEKKKKSAFCSKTKEKQKRKQKKELLPLRKTLLKMVTKSLRASNLTSANTARIHPSES
jgi:hypothetical protein